MDETRRNMDKIPATAMLSSMSRTVAKLQVEPLSSAERLRGHHLVSGFVGQRIVKLSEDVIDAAARQPLTRPLLASSAGFYPKAAGHLASRPVGIDQTIFIYCTAGNGWCETQEKRHAIKPGQLLVLPANTAHSYGADSNNPWTIRWFQAVGSQIPAFLETLGVTAEQPVIVLGEDPMLNILFEEVLTELFKAQTGYAPKDYFTRLKMHHASQLLNGTNLSVKEIAEKVGFEDPLHFSRVFKQINALSPTEHRKKPDAKK
jgi:hypothetical protein